LTATATAPLRVMHVVVAGDIGGAERLLVDLASRPARTGATHEVALITPNRELAAYFVAAGVSVHDRGPARDSAFAYLVRSLGRADVTWLGRLFAERGVDVVHTHTFASHVVGTRAARLAGLPQLRTEHHVMHYFDPSCSPFTRWAAARTDAFAAVSDYVRRVLERTAPSIAARMKVVRNGIDTDYWAPRARAFDRFRVGVVCRLTAWKRVHLAIRAAARASAEHHDGGDGEERARLEAVARRCGATAIFAGHQDDPRPHVASCDVVVSTADREPLGLSVLESLAMERPVIAYGGGGIPEIVQDGVTGWLVPEASPAAFAAAIRRARDLGSHLAEMGKHARSFAAGSGHIDATCEGYAAMYRELALRGAGRSEATLAGAP
jgi:glycosyltransferase involved in cell wall biosynthesis